jgi:hypothetical protein
LIAGACPCPPRKTAEHSNTIAKRVAKIGCGCSVETCFCKRPRKMFFFAFHEEFSHRTAGKQRSADKKNKTKHQTTQKKTKQSTKQPNLPLTHPPNQMAQIDAKKRLCLSVSHVAVDRSRSTQTKSLFSDMCADDKRKRVGSQIRQAAGKQTALICGSAFATCECWLACVWSSAQNALVSKCGCGLRLGRTGIVFAVLQFLVRVAVLQFLVRVAVLQFLVRVALATFRSIG